MRPALGIYLAGQPRGRHALASGLRRAGVAVAEEMDLPPPTDDVLLARAHQSGFSRAVVLDGKGARWLDADGAQGRITARAVASLASSGEPLAAIIPARYLGAPRRATT